MQKCPIRPFLTSLKNRLTKSQANPVAGSTKRPTISALLIDVSGTLRVGKEPTPGAIDAFKRLISSECPFRLCSNTSKESTADLVSDLDALGFALSDAQSALAKDNQIGLSGRAYEPTLVWTSIGAVAQALKEAGSTNPYLLLSESAKAEVVTSLHSGKPYPSTSSNDTNHDSVVIGLAPTLLDYEHLNMAFRILKGEVPGTTTITPCLIATHRAKYFQSGTGNLSLGPGPFVTALENAAGPNVQVKVVGKPEPIFFEMVIKDFGVLDKPPSDKESWCSSSPRIAVIGDDVEADLGGGAIKLGLWRVLVKTGKYRPGAELLPGIVPPDEIHESFACFIHSFLDRQNETSKLTGFAETI